ncbi:hypothetical protein ABDK56_08880 [Sphingomonas sp. ASV193]|uniref:hypothetical protein n=1 Tax=Sphingomonas sp. ASV193 TaxID=3144405 RepID=UPI0032E85746
MSKHILALASALLVSAAPVLAGPGGGHGGGGPGGGHGGGPGGGHGNGGGGGHAMMMGGPGGGHGNGGGHGGGPGGGHGGGRPAFAGFQQHGGGHARGGGHHMRVERQAQRVEQGRAARQERMAERGNGHGRAMAVGGAAAAAVAGGVAMHEYAQSHNAQGYGVGGCPPGLANKGCMPPGQAKKYVGSALPATYANDMLGGAWRSWYPDNNQYYYRMGDGMIYRVDRADNLVNALIPYGISDYGYYPVGDVYPADYNYYNVPYPYQGYYPDGGDLAYRYGNGAIYGVDPRTNMVQSIVALLAGDLAIGQRLPADYGVYNVPLAYRSQYYDTPNDWYRYNDGYIYRVDPATQLITAIAKALV